MAKVVDGSAQTVFAFLLIKEHGQFLGLETLVSDVAEDVEFTVEENVIVTKAEMYNKPLKIGTTAMDEQTGSHHGAFSEAETIKDIVELSGLYEGRTYMARGSLVDRTSGNVLKGPDGRDAIAEKVFTAGGDFAEIGLDFTIDSTAFTEGNFAVGFEKLYRVYETEGEPQSGEAGGNETHETEIACHENANDPAQTICYGGIIGTRASDSKGKSKNIRSKRTAVIKDFVEYKGLSVMEEYTLEAVLFDKTTGKLTGITRVLNFTPATSDGTAEVTFRFDSRGLEGHTMVAFETLRLRGRFISDHKDPEDEAQTVYIKGRKVPDTGERGRLLAWICFMTLAGMTLLVMTVKRYMMQRHDEL